MTFVSRKISIQRNQSGLGFVLAGQNPCIVSSITHNGPADIATLRTGDEILEVDFMNVAHMKHDEVVRRILCDTVGKVILNVRTFLASKDLLLSPGQRYHSQHGHSAQVMKDISNKLLGSASPQTSLIHRKCEKDGPSLTSNAVDHQKSEKTLLLNKDKRLSSLSKRRTIKDDRRIPCDSKNNTDNSTTGANTSSKYLQGIFGVESKDERHADKTKSSPLADKNSSTSSLKTFSEKKKPYAFDAIVYYKCSQEISEVSSNLPASSLDTLKNCVQALKKKHNTNSALVLLTITEKGVKMSKPLGKEIITYPLKNIIFSAVCAYDRNYFGLVTKNGIHNTSLVESKAHGTSSINGLPPVSFCHVFKIDPTLRSHDAHHVYAALFDFTCVLGSEKDCQQFPKTSSEILMELNSFYEEKYVRFISTVM